MKAKLLAAICGLCATLAVHAYTPEAMQIALKDLNVLETIKEGKTVYSAK